MRTQHLLNAIWWYIQGRCHSFKSWASLPLSSSLCASCRTNRPVSLVLLGLSHSLLLLSFSTLSINFCLRTPTSLQSCSTGCHSLEAPSFMALIPTTSSLAVEKRYPKCLRRCDPQSHANFFRSMAMYLPSYYLGRRRLYVWGLGGTTSYSMESTRISTPRKSTALSLPPCLVRMWCTTARMQSSWSRKRCVRASMAIVSGS